MIRRTLASLLAAAGVVAAVPPADAAGFIVVDPVGGTAPVMAMMQPVRPPMPPVVRPPRHPGIRPPITRPPVTRPPVTRPPILHGHVSHGLHLQSEAIRVDVNDQVARTYITQTFVNDTDRNLAGTYMFPLPDDTTFSSFSLHIDGKPVEGKILEANEARQQYEEIVRRMVDPGLLEYADYKTVRARIFPIPAHGTKKVELEYTQVLRAENGMIKYRFPLKAQGESPAVDEVKIDVKLASKQGLRTIWSPSHTVSSTRTDNNRAKVALLQKNTVPDRDFLLYYSVSDRELSANLLTHKNEGQDGYFLLTLSPPVQTKQVIAKDLVLVADTSGSMSGEKMEQCKKALKYVVNALNPSDRFNIIQFNNDAEKFRSGLLTATQENKKAAVEFIDDLEARGGTNIGDALNMGMSLLNQPSERPAYLVFMTDGEPTVGETNVAKLVKTGAAQRDVRLFDFGVGYDVNTKLLNKLAESHHGTSQYVEPNEDIEVAVSGLYQKIKSPVLSNVNIAYEGIQVKDVYPREVKDIFAGSQVLLIGKYKGSGRASVRLTGKVNGEAKTFTFPLSFASEQVDHTYLPRLWAMRRIGNLTEVAQENGNTREVVDEIVSLSKKYGIISAYTSFLVTDPSETGGVNRPMPVPAQVAASMPREEGRAGGSGGGVAIRADRSRQAFRAEAMSRDSFFRDSRKIAMDEEGRRNGALYGGFVSLPAAVMSTSATPVGKAAVVASKRVSEFKQRSVASAEADKDAHIKSVEDKTFYLRDGFWTDSTFNSHQKPQVIRFGSNEYFNLIRSNPGISKYLAIGKQVILMFKGNCYKIVVTANG